MRYLIDAEFRDTLRQRPSSQAPPFATALRQELSQRNVRWALDHGYVHEVTLGLIPAVLYREDERGRHGNFLDATYHHIRQTPAYAHRLNKVHTSAKRALLSRDMGRRELDSSNSSDALLMNVFCHPGAMAASALCSLLAVKAKTDLVFGYRPGIPLSSGHRDSTEVDLRLGDLLIESKLTEHDFQTAPRRLIDRYRDIGSVFDVDQLDFQGGLVQSYQLIRGVLAAYAGPGLRFCVLCDARRPDLVDAWHRVLMTVQSCELRSRLQLLTWQELSAVLPLQLQAFLEQKYGIHSANVNHPGLSHESTWQDRK